MPRFGALRIVELTMAVVVLWLDDLAAAGTLKPSSQRGLLGLLSRFCSWCVDRGLMTSNPCKAIPGGRRPHGARGGADIPWISDDTTVLRIFERLPEPIRLIWLLTNRAGLRCGEAAGLTMGDLDGMREGALRVQHNYLSPMLKEAKGTPKTKWVPAPSDLEDFLGRWIERRRAEGAGSDDLVFPRDGGRWCFNKDQVGAAFRKVRDQLGLPRALTAHRAGRHSFASRLLASGAAVAEVSSALGHADGGRLLMQTYNHFVRRTWSPALVAPMTVPPARIIPIAAARASAVDPASVAAQLDEPISVPDSKARKAGGR